MNTSQNILITGAMRSGTTYVGQVLEKAGGFTYFHEPFKNKHGITGIDHWFPFYLSNDYAEKVDNFFKGNSKFRIRKHKGNKIWEYYYKKIFGNRDQIKYRNYFKNKNTTAKKLLLKDPLAAFLSNYIYSKNNAKVVIVVRHPMAFYYSKKQKGWDFDFNNFLEQPELIDKYLKEEVPLMEKAKNSGYEYRIGLLWKCIYKVLTAFENEHGNETGWIVMKHEDILESPIESFQILCDKLEIQFTDAMRTFILETSFNKTKTLSQENQIHDFKRDSLALKDYWKKNVSLEQCEIIYGLTKEVADLYYPETSWELSINTSA